MPDALRAPTSPVAASGPITLTYLALVAFYSSARLACELSHSLSRRQMRAIVTHIRIFGLGFNRHVLIGMADA